MTIQRRGRLRLVTLAAVVAAALMGTTLAMAEGDFGGPPPYDKKTETTLKGSIQEVKMVHAQNGIEGVHLMLKDGKGVVEVFAGPQMFLARVGASFAKGDAIEVIGSKMQIEGVSALIARKIKKGAKTFELRDELGAPMWNRP